MRTILGKLRNSRGCYLALALGLGVELITLAVILGYWSYQLGFFGKRPVEPVGAVSEITITRTPFSFPTDTLMPNNPTATLAGQETRYVFATLSPTEIVTPTPSIALEELTLTPTEFELANPRSGKIVFTCFDGKFDQICLMNADGTARRKLTKEDSPNFYPSLSRDGKHIVFSSRRDGNYEIFIMDVSGENVTQLTDNIGSLYAPEISPKGNRIVFTVASGGKQAIWVMRIDGSNPHPLTDYFRDDIDSTWSPTGEKIAFASDRTGKTQLYVMNTDGSGVRQITHTELKIGGRSSWSPDGTRLAFYAGPQYERNIYLVDLDGKNIEQLTDGGDNLGPCFSPDGQWIAFTSFRDGNNEIYTLHLADLSVHRITDNPNSDWQPRWGE